jgi:predicted DNA-binding transcriptional regulator YafY
MDATLRKAISERKCIVIKYEDGGARTVEPHCFGETTASNKALRAYQINGSSSSGNSQGWKMFELSKIRSIEILKNGFSPRADYKKNDKGMNQIFSQV